MQFASDPKVKDAFDNYPRNIRPLLLRLRKLVLETASEIEDITDMEETLKWGEPSYLTKHGSTIRMDWKENHPDRYAMYFKCTSKLLPTFRKLYPDTFQYEGDRAIVFGLKDPIPEYELKHCIAIALTYHKRKHLDMLGEAVGRSLRKKKLN